MRNRVLQVNMPRFGELSPHACRRGAPTVFIVKHNRPFITDHQKFISSHEHPRKSSRLVGPVFSADNKAGVEFHTATWETCGEHSEGAWLRIRALEKVLLDTRLIGKVRNRGEGSGCSYRKMRTHQARQYTSEAECSHNAELRWDSTLPNMCRVRFPAGVAVPVETSIT